MAARAPGIDRVVGTGYSAAMLKERKSGLELLRFQALCNLPGVVHAVTTRRGGVSGPPYDSLNLADGGDDPAAVAVNRDRLRQALGLERLVWAKQVHGAEVLAVDSEADGLVGEADGLATDQPGVGLLIKQADCQAVVLVEPEARVIANLHAGWRGNVADMAGAGVRFLVETYGIDPAGLYAAISPSLGPCCAEFVNHAEELGPEFLLYQARPDYFDLWQVTWDQLVAAGVGRDRIEFSAICTKCQDKFFSYRREGTTGRFGTVVALA